jgi:hypothetical protein
MRLAEVCHCCCVMDDKSEDDRLFGHAKKKKCEPHILILYLGRSTDTDTDGNCVQTVIRRLSGFEFQDGWTGPTEEEIIADTLLDR